MDKIRELIESGIDDQEKLENILLSIVDAIDALTEEPEEIEEPKQKLGIFGKKKGGDE